MDDSRNQPELETLNYKPICSRCQQKNCQCRSILLKPHKDVMDLKLSINTPSTAMGFNSAVIKPETRANKTESTEESSEQPNQNIMIIEEIEGLMSQVNDKLESLNIISIIPLIRRSQAIKTVNQALEDTDLFQKTTLFKLRQAFE